MRIKFLFLAITLSLLTLLTLSVSKAADPVGTLGVKIKVKTSPFYLAEVAKAKEQGASFSCQSVAEQLSSKDYSSSSAGSSIYSLVILNCMYNPHDGLDAYRVMGLATLSGDQVISFSTAAVLQPE